MKRRFLTPIGSPEDRLAGKVPPGKWTDVTGYLAYYQIKPGVWNYHSGSDWNLNYPNFDADAHSAVYAIGPGVVTYAQRWPNPNAWGEIIVIDHGIVDGKPCFSRSAHVEHRYVSVGQQVDEWTHIADIGNGNSLFAYHLHHDISLTYQLRDYPGDWPGLREDLVKLNYVDPVLWLREEHEIEGDDMPDNLIVTASNGLPLLEELPLAKNTAVIGHETTVLGTATYRRAEVNGKFGYLLEKLGSDVYLAPPTPILTMYVNSDPFINVRSQPTTSSSILSTIPKNTQVRVQDIGVVANGYTWVRLVDQLGYVAKELLRPNP